MATVSIKQQLIDHLEKGRDWERMETPVPGLLIGKAPASNKMPATLFLEINPEKKWKGLFVYTEENLNDLISVVIDEKTREIITEIEEVNPSEIIKKHKKPTKKLDF